MKAMMKIVIQYQNVFAVGKCLSKLISGGEPFVVYVTLLKKKSKNNHLQSMNRLFGIIQLFGRNFE